MALDLVLLERIRNNEVVDLSINEELSIEEIALLAEALPQCKGLHSIRLSKNKIGDEGAKALAIVLPQCHNLHSIELSTNDIRNEGAKALAIVLPQCTNLQNINVLGNYIGAEGATALAIALPQCTNLHSIDLSLNCIGDGGVKALSIALPQCANLQNINVWGDDIRDEGAKALAIALPQCTNLQSINVSYNNIGDAGIIAILSSLEGNQCIIDCNIIFGNVILGNINQNNINAICNANKERIHNTYQVTTLDKLLQNESLYKKLYSCPELTRAIEDGFIPVATVHTLFQGKSIEEINRMDIRDQSISALLKEHYTNPDLSDELLRLLEKGVEKNFYGYDVIPTIIEYGHFTFAKDLIESSGAASYAKYFTPLMYAAPDPGELSDYILLAHVILDKIPDLHSNASYMQEAINHRKSTLVQSLINHHASSEGVTTTHQQGFSEDAIISDMLNNYNSVPEQEQVVTMTGGLSLEAEG